MKRLYTDITIDVRVRNEQLSRFDSLLKNGVQEHLQHTRSLSLFDRDSPSFFNPEYPENQQNLLSERHMRDRLLMAVLRCFPDHKLRTFR